MAVRQYFKKSKI